MSDAPSEPRSRPGVVVIGRNEGPKLRVCLESVTGEASAVIYVDSGSTDGSIAMARSLGVEVVELDLAEPFTAARARNAGIERLKEMDPGVVFVQVLDGDCEVVKGWLEAGLDVLREREGVAVVCGRRRERHPEASIYNRLCDLEWDSPVGETTACGGDALIRLAAFDEVGGYDPSVIAGEEPEMCLRLRRAGWTIVRIDREMTRHDANMTRFGQWWRRAVRSGHAYAQGRAMHGATPEGYCVHQVRSILEWAVLLPLLALGLAWVTWGASLTLVAAYALLWQRVRKTRLEMGDSANGALLYARYCVLGKFAECQGIVRYFLNRLFGRRATIIEYK